MTTLHRAADLLDLLAARGGAIRLNELADALDTPKSSIHRLCAAMVDVGILRRDGAGAYGMGPRLISWALAADLAAELSAIALPIMRRFSETVGEAVNLHIPGGLDRICIATLPGRFSLVPALYVGMRKPIGLGASGKVLLAYAGPGVIEAGRKALSAAGHPAPSDEELAEIRRLRWATSRDEQEIGLSAAGAPVFGGNGEAIAVVTVGGATARLSPQVLSEMRGPLGECADSITAQMQMQGGLAADGLPRAGR